MALDPLVTLAALVVAYRLRPKNRRSTGEQSRHETPDRDREFASAS